MVFVWDDDQISSTSVTSFFRTGAVLAFDDESQSL